MMNIILTKNSCLILLIALFLITACDENESGSESPLIFTSIDIPEAYLISNNTRADIDETEIHEVDILITNDAGSEIKGLIQIILPEMGGDQLYSLALTQNILEESNLSAGFRIEHMDLNQPEANGRSNAESCIVQCHETFTDASVKKIKGRGAYKAHYWADTIRGVMIALK
tara:strand:- start:184 stop:699 length:516 start_codon:yes stop_codon:yes gene_type:complete